MHASVFALKLELFKIVEMLQKENFLDTFCGDSAVQPVVLTRSDTNNPFGPTYCYGTDQIIVEVCFNSFFFFFHSSVV